MQFEKGTILDRTAETTTQFHYKLESSRDKEFGAEFKPTAKVGPEGAATEVSLVSLTAKNKDRSGGHIDYTANESTLSVTGVANSVTWDFSIVRGKHAIRDFLSCNLPLWIDCKPQFKHLRGTVELLPSIFNFDRDKVQMSAMKSLLMQMTLAFRKSHKDDPEKSPLLNPEGIRLSFGENK